MLIDTLQWLQAWVFFYVCAFILKSRSQSCDLEEWRLETKERIPDNTKAKQQGQAWIMAASAETQVFDGRHKLHSRLLRVANTRSHRYLAIVFSSRIKGFCISWRCHSLVACCFSTRGIWRLMSVLGRGLQIVNKGKIILLFQMGVTRGCVAFRCQCNSDVSLFHLHKRHPCTKSLPIPFMVREMVNSAS